MKAGNLYAKFRTGKAFFIGFTSFVFFWLFCKKVPFINHWDDGLSLLNIILSVEASIATSMLLMDGETTSAMHQKQLKYQLQIMEAILAHVTNKQNNIEMQSILVYVTELTSEVKKLHTAISEMERRLKG